MANITCPIETLVNFPCYMLLHSHTVMQDEKLPPFFFIHSCFSCTRRSGRRWGLMRALPASSTNHTRADRILVISIILPWYASWLIWLWLSANHSGKFLNGSAPQPVFCISPQENPLESCKVNVVGQRTTHGYRAIFDDKIQNTCHYSLEYYSRCDFDIFA